MKCDMKEKEKYQIFAARGVKMEEKKRYNLGVLIGGVHTYFPKEHIKGISEAASELDVNVCFFLGTRTKDFLKMSWAANRKIPMTINLIPYMTTA